IRKLLEMAKQRNQSLSQMALAWTLRVPPVVSALVGTSSVEQIEENVDTLKNLEFTQEELGAIEGILS
ncbi:MAG: aldo/keto reductase, partial [Bacteroidota bacterium]